MKEVTMTGLTNEQVQQRIEEGKVNANENPNTRSYKQIVRENVLTFFNFLNLALMVMVLLVGSYKNSMFMGIIVINTVIGIIQEVRAKKTLDKLAILTESKAVVLREGKKWTISTEKLVLDDILFLKTGDQVPADAKVLEGSIEVNESLLTGESDNLQKIEGDELFSGSFVTSGEACCQVIHVGKDNYASQITSEAKEFKRHNSELRNSLNAILKTISVIIVLGTSAVLQAVLCCREWNPGRCCKYGGSGFGNDPGGTGAAYQCGFDPGSSCPDPEEHPGAGIILY